MSSQSMFERPIVGAAGYAAIDTPLYASLPQAGAVHTILPQGSAFTIVEEQGDYWLVQAATAPRGYLYRAHCFVNLPDLLPSAIYLCPNASASVMRSCGRDIPTLTGEQLYAAHAHNPRLGRGAFRVPLLYAAAKKLASAQRAALANGDCIVVYEGFRPLAVQQRIVAALTALAKADAVVMDSITAAPWEIDWFISTGISKHQRGMAMDLGLAKLTAPADAAPQNLHEPHGRPMVAPTISKAPADAAPQNLHEPHGRPMVAPTILKAPADAAPQNLHEPHGDAAYTLYQMPTPIHELSRASASLAYPVTSRDDIAWRSVPDAPAMTDGARRLRDYCTGARLTPLASEWWHFNDLEAVQLDGTEHFTLP